MLVNKLFDASKSVGSKRKEEPGSNPGPGENLSPKLTTQDLPDSLKTKFSDERNFESF